MRFVSSHRTDRIINATNLSSFPTAQCSELDPWTPLAGLVSSTGNDLVPSSGTIQTNQTTPQTKLPLHWLLKIPVFRQICSTSANLDPDVVARWYFQEAVAAELANSKTKEPVEIQCYGLQNRIRFDRLRSRTDGSGARTPSADVWTAQDFILAVRAGPPPDSCSFSQITPSQCCDQESRRVMGLYGHSSQTDDIQSVLTNLREQSEKLLQRYNQIKNEATSQTEKQSVLAEISQMIADLNPAPPVPAVSTPSSLTTASDASSAEEKQKKVLEMLEQHALQLQEHSEKLDRILQSLSVCKRRRSAPRRRSDPEQDSTLIQPEDFFCLRLQNAFSSRSAAVHLDFLALPGVHPNGFVHRWLEQRRDFLPPALLARVFAAVAEQAFGVGQKSFETTNLDANSRADKKRETAFKFLMAIRQEM